MFALRVRIIAISVLLVAFSVYSGDVYSQAQKKPPPAPQSTSSQVKAKPAAPQQPVAEVEERRPAKIDRNGVLILVRTVLIAIDQANKTNNYSVLLGLGAPLFQQAGAQKLADMFRKLREDGVDLSAAALLVPELTDSPYLDQRGLMHLNGVFPAVGQQIVFELQFAPIGNVWKIFSVNVRLSSMAPIVTGVGENDQVINSSSSVPNVKPKQ